MPSHTYINTRGKNKKQTDELAWVANLPVYCTLADCAKEFGCSHQAVAKAERRMLLKITRAIREFADEFHS